MPDIFISYSRKDKAFVKRLFDALESHSKDAWVDWENIPLTAEWLEEIYSGIESSDAFAFVISPDSVRSEVCSLELGHAIEHNKRLVPIMHRDLVEAHDRAALHPSISSHNWIFFNDENHFDQSIKHLIDALNTDLRHLQTHTRLLMRSVEWNEKERDHSHVLRGTELKEAQQWLAQSEGKQPVPTELQRDYIEASQKAAAARQRNIILTAVYGLVVLSLAVFAFWQALNAENRRLEADTQRGIAVNNAATAVAAQATSVFNEGLAQSLALASNAQEVLYRDNNPSLAVVIALAANSGEHISRLAPSVLAQAAYSPGQRIVKEGFAEYGARVALDTTGELALSAAAENDLILWNLETGEELHRWPFGDHQIYAVEFSPQNDHILVATIANEAGEAGELVLYDARTFDEIMQIPEVENFNDLAFNTDGTKAAAGSENGTVFIYEIPSGNLLNRYDFEGDIVWSVLFNLDDSEVFASYDSGEVRGWNIETGDFYSLTTTRIEAEALALTPDGQRLLVGYGDGAIIIWGLETREQIDQLTGHTNDVWDIAISPDGKTAISGSYDTTLIYWNLEKDEPLRRFIGHTSAVYGVDITDDGRVLSGAWDGTMRVWDLYNGAELARYEPHDDWVWSVVPFVGEDGAQMLLSSSRNAVIILSNLDTGEARTFETVHTADIIGLDLNQDHTQAISSSRDGQVVLWDLASGKPLRLLEGHSGAVRSVAFSPDGKKALSGGENSDSSEAEIILWDMTDFAEICRFSGHDGRVWSVDFSSDGKWAVSGSVDKLVLLWDVENCQEIGRFVGHEGVVYSVRFSPDNSQILSASEDGSLRLWDIASQQELRRFSGHTADVNSAVFSPDGLTIISGSDDRSIHLWDVAAGVELQRFEGHTDEILGVAFIDDGRKAISGAKDATIRSWQIQSLEELTTWTYANRYIPSLTAEQCRLYRIEGFCAAGQAAQ